MSCKTYGGRFDVDKLEDRRLALEVDITHENFWDDNRKAQAVMKELETTKQQLEQYNGVKTAIEDVQVLIEFHDADPSEDAKAEVETAILTAQSKLSEIQLSRMLSGPLDANGCYLLINAGAGGTESCDWASMLCRMYMRYAERHGHRVDVIDFTEGDGAGYRSVTLQIDGSFAYGFLKAENGVHRLVRISPFDANNRRHTSFCSVFVHAQVNDDIDIEVREEDLEIEAIRASGAGGQKVNKTSSAIRMVHKPTGIAVKCQTERSQNQNRSTALKMLKARLYEIELAKRNAEKQKIEDTKQDIAWGSQIRSYVLHPYQMVKDHRTDFETSQSQKVLDGEIDDFIKSYLVAGDKAGNV